VAGAALWLCVWVLPLVLVLVLVPLVVRVALSLMVAPLGEKQWGLLKNLGHEQEQEQE
jgi:hypothetical protein